MENIRAVIFDMDGVIFDSEALWKIMFLKANEKYDLTLDEQYRQSICGKNETYIRIELKKMFNSLDVDEYRNFIIGGVNSMIEKGQFDIKPGVCELISFLKDCGYKTALATSSSYSRAENMFKTKGLNLKEMFDVCVFGDEVGKRCKPDPYIFEIAAMRLGIANEECIVLEDSINGINAAVNGGFLPVMAVDIIQPDDFCKEKCYRIINNLTELIETMESGI